MQTVICHTLCVLDPGTLAKDCEGMKKGHTHRHLYRKSEINWECAHWWRASTATSNPEPWVFWLEDSVRAVSEVAESCSC